MTEKWIEIEIDWDTGKIIAKVEGYADSVECKNEIMELIEDMVDIYEGGWTIDIHTPKPNAKQRRSTQSKGKKKTTN